MKKIFCFLLCVFILAVAFGCSKDGGNKTTLMIYMIGSDLETKGDSATADLKEIEESEKC